jgi:hypothetical protein
MSTPPQHPAHDAPEPDPSGSVVAAGATAHDLQRTSERPASLTAREIGRHRVALAAGFVAGGGLAATAGLPLRAIGLGPRTPSLKGMRMRSRKMNAQLAPAMMSLAATNQQLLGLVGSRRNIMWRIVPLGVAAAGFRYMTAEPDERQQMVEQAQALLAQGQAILESTGVMEKVFK